METHLPEEVVRHIFSFLGASSLLQVSQVNKFWNSIAESEHLWRKLCLKRWNFWDFTCKCLGTQTWKQAFLHQIKKERRMALAQPDDFIYKEASGNFVFEELAYLSGKKLRRDGQEKSIICTITSRHVLYAWDVQEGIMIWSSPVQLFKMNHLATIPQMHLAITTDFGGTIKVWNCQDRDALADVAIPGVCVSLETCFSKDNPFIMVGNSEGDIYAFTVPDLTNISHVNAFQYSMNLLHCSPDKKWVFACRTHQHILPKVFFTESLLRPSEGSTPLSCSLSFSSCCRACWTPRKESRITLMFQKSTTRRMGFATFDLTMEKTGGQTDIQAQLIGSFLLPVNMGLSLWMGVSPENLIVCESGPSLFLFTISGLLLQQFENHQNNISLWVDSLHVVTVSMDDSLHLYMWEEEGRYPYLKSCCHLAHKQHEEPQYKEALLRTLNFPDSL
ncbi:F-box/WD repeat-containing protein 12 [Nycticebus coucang]|uniref:F-box/WD repeat-containing protein 12 n=1 Tax=Nycticebus coucang TaxID=9470 RepID=UPI00234DF29F|nr:F-box/WD repeat-containing protein 12 [Nycticebus coucang]